MIINTIIYLTERVEEGLQRYKPVKEKYGPKYALVMVLNMVYVSNTINSTFG